MRPTTRRTLESSMRHPPAVTRDLRPRQLPTDTSHAVPTGECQSDPPSLLRTLRCSRPRGQPQPSRALDLLLHVRAGSGWPAAASPTRRSSSPAPASWPASSGRSRPSNHSEATDPIPPLDLQQRMRPTTRRTLESSMRHPPAVTRDLSPSLPYTTLFRSVPTGECQSDPPSLLRTLRCSRPRG